MSAFDDSDIRAVVSRILADRQGGSQRVDDTVAAVVTVEQDRRFFCETLRSVVHQRVVPGVIVIVDCTGTVTQSLQSTFTPQTVPDARALVGDPVSVSVRIVGVDKARSFADAVRQGLELAHVDESVRALWMLHDDSRPADDRCLDTLLEAWGNTPTASVLGCKQLDWSGKNLHHVGWYAGRHRIRTLVVDGEPDQEQYDGRQDVFGVSLAGALVPTAALHSVEGIDPWFGTMGESVDFCRRICLSGGRVMVVPSARIAHRRARFEGVRSRSGQPIQHGAVHADMSALDGARRYRSTDIAAWTWLFAWVAAVLRSLVGALSQLFSKRPYRAWCVLCMPWKALCDIPSSLRARRRVTKQSSVSLSALPMLTVTHAQLARWRDRVRAFDDQRHRMLLGPLAMDHLRQRLVRRWIGALAMAIIALSVVLWAAWTPLRAAMTGEALYSSSLVSTDASFAQLLRAASTSWAYGVGTGVAVPAAPWLWVLVLASCFTLGHVAAAVVLLYVVSAPVSALSMWALSGIFTRSNMVRVCTGLLWVALGLASGCYAEANMPMLTMMMFLPAAFAFAFRAVGMYRTEDPVRSHSSVQAAALASLCFVPALCAEPQLLVALAVLFVVCVVAVRSHRLMLLLMPVPSLVVMWPTLWDALRHGMDGSWRQLFADMTLPVGADRGAPKSNNLIDVIMRAFAQASSSEWSSPADYWLLAVLVLACVLVTLALVSMVLPDMLRESRMMWVVMLTGALTAMISSGVSVSVDIEGPVAGSVLPGVMLMMMGALSCVCVLAGAAVRRFVPLRVSLSTQIDNDRSNRIPVRLVAARMGRAVLVLALVVGIVVCSGYGVFRRDSSVASSSDALPMVATDYLQGDDAHRIVALSVPSANHVTYTMMRTARGDLIDISPAWQVEQALGHRLDSDDAVAKAAARLLAAADDDAVASLDKLGVGGIYVVRDDQGDVDATDQLMAHITASDGTQLVTGARQGSYYRITLREVNRQGIATGKQQRAQQEPGRSLWLWTSGVVVSLYCVVAVPRPRRSVGEEV